MSFAQHVVFTTLSDPEVVDNPSVLCEEFVKGFDQLELIVMGENIQNTTDSTVFERTEKTLETAKEREMQRRNSRAIILPEDIRRSIQEAKKKNSSRSLTQPVSGRETGGRAQSVAKTVQNSTGTSVTVQGVRRNSAGHIQMTNSGFGGGEGASTAEPAPAAGGGSSRSAVIAVEP